MMLNLPVIGVNDNVIAKVNVSVQGGRAETMYAIGADVSGRYTEEEKLEAIKKANAYERDFFEKRFTEGGPASAKYSQTVEWFDSLSAEDQAFFRKQGWKREAYVARVDYWREREAGIEAGTISPNSDYKKDPKWKAVLELFKGTEEAYGAWFKDWGQKWGELQKSRLERQDVVDLSPQALDHLQQTAAVNDAGKN